MGSNRDSRFHSRKEKAKETEASEKPENKEDLGRTGKTEGKGEVAMARKREEERGLNRGGGEGRKQEGGIWGVNIYNLRWKET